ncbi:hypothetical protein FHW96_001859 [Novosphingobium sp. SG751A]|uniref:hypothetical protein n=1 Tax=Novosphingobium sp. SG751A TaxID=2587000 RepID=UPI0015521F12|nr:hypothetical protein [Novosphingobium sp. SG751A]NOW45704.1 hypothetical protein [Novosphingobium sp. SG751A]
MFGSNGQLILKESDRGAKLKKLSLRNVPAGSVAFELDHTPSGQLKSKLKNAFKQLSCLINSQHTRANKKCDAVIFVPIDENSIDAYIIDLKSFSPDKRDCEMQLENSEYFLKYIENLLKEYFGINSVFSYKKIIIQAQNPILSKNPAQQANIAKSIHVKNGIKYCEVTLGGRSNSEAIFSLSHCK